MMDSPHQLVAFHLDDWRYALWLSAVERIVMMAEITPLPKAPPIVSGVINFQGRILPVVDIRKRFQLPERETALGDHVIIANTKRRTVAMVVDAVSGVIESPDMKIVAAEKVVPGLEHVQGVAKLEDGMVLIHDLEIFLSLEEESLLEQALAPA